MLSTIINILFINKETCVETCVIENVVITSDLINVIEIMIMIF